jgi:lipopolysaccharide transport system permease protein
MRIELNGSPVERLPGERLIRAERSFVMLDWRRLLRYQDLLWVMVRRDFVARYQQTILGPVWFVLQPLIATGAFTLIFSGGLGTSTDGIAPAFLFYQCGMLVWSYFSLVLGGAGNTFQSNAAVFTKVYFPRLIVPLSVVLGSLAPFVLQVAVFVACYLPFVRGAGWHPHLGALLTLPWFVFQAAVFGLGLSLLTSACSAKYRDLQHALPFLLQLGLFVTPVIYPLSKLGPTARAVADLNPLASAVEAFRLGFFGVGTLDARSVGIGLAGTVGTVVAGLLAFQRAERTFVDTI